MPHGITQCYLPPGRSDIPALTPAEAGTRLSDPGGMQGLSRPRCAPHSRQIATPSPHHSIFTGRMPFLTPS